MSDEWVDVAIRDNVDEGYLRVADEKDGVPRYSLTFLGQARVELMGRTRKQQEQYVAGLLERIAELERRAS